MNNFEKVIKKLKKIGNERPDPEDHLYNIVKCVEDVDLNDEEWCNFYRYITCQDKSDFEYLPRNQIVTLGDLGDEKLQEMQKDMGYGEANGSFGANKRTPFYRDLKDAIYSELNFISIYMKPQGEKADLEEPLVVISGTTVGQVAHTLHRDFKDKFRYAQVWGPASKFPGQTVGLKHTLKNGDLLTIITHR